MPEILLGVMIAMFVTILLGLIAVALVILPLWMADLIL